MGFKITWGKRTSLKALKGLKASRLLDKEATLETCKKLTPHVDGEAMIDDYPRASLNSGSFERLKRWIRTWRSEHSHLKDHPTGRECEALAKALSSDIVLFCEVNDLEAVPLVAWGRGFSGGRGHACVFVFAVGEWHSIDPRVERVTIDRPMALYPV